MTDSQHPITPPPELVQDWRNQAPTARDAGLTREWWIATQAARWGADQELEACANWLTDPCAADMASLAKDLRYSRRPKPPSLREQALAAFERILNHSSTELGADTIRRALEQLDD